MKLFFGTKNPGKIRELSRLVSGLDLLVVSPGDLPQKLPEVVEDGETFLANAEHKAKSYAEVTGLLSLADDSGLCVDALFGAPGVRSARFADLDRVGHLSSPACELAGVAAFELGEEAARALRDERNNEKLLESLAGLGPEKRLGHYVAVLSLAWPDGTIAGSVEGICKGRILGSRRGTGGFGYDPLFQPEAEWPERGRLGRTMAELTAAEKDAISHRGAAFRALRPLIERCLLDGRSSNG